MNLWGASHFIFWKRLGFWGQCFSLERGRAAFATQLPFEIFWPLLTTSGPNGPRSPVLSSLMSDMQVVFQIHLHNNKTHIWSWYKLCIYQAFSETVVHSHSTQRRRGLNCFWQHCYWWLCCLVITIMFWVVFNISILHIFEGNGKCDGDVQQGQGSTGRQ